MPVVNSPHKGPILRSIGVFFVASSNTLMNKQSSYRWFGTSWRSCDVTETCRYLFLRHRVVIGAIPGNLVLSTLAFLVGWIVFAYYTLEGCDPMEAGLLSNPNQVIVDELQWRHNEPHGVSKHQPHDCLLNGLLRWRSKKTSKPRVTGLCEGNSPVTGEFPAQRASNGENVSIWWRHHV